MKKVIFAQILLLLLLAIIICIFLRKRQTADVPLSAVSDALESAFVMDGMETGQAMRLKRAFGLNAADYEDFIYYTPDNTMSVNEILIIKVSDDEQLSDIEAAFSTRLEAQKTAFNGYGVNQTDLLNHAETLIESPYAVFIVGSDASKMLETVRELWEVSDGIQ